MQPTHRHSQPSLSLAAILVTICLIHLAGVLGAAPARNIPTPIEGHPGNVFLAGEEIVVSLPSAPGAAWRLLDYQDRVLEEVSPTDGKARLGALPIGFFRLRPVQGASNVWVSLAVLERLRAPTPASSPIAIDVAMSWFYPQEKMDAAASLCALAGMNWVRDRLSWAEMERKRGQFSATNRYDAAALAQSRAGLRVLQVTHVSPSWANPETKRFPLDLRDAYHFWREMARRWKGQVEAFEPWNEADITVFGGHTGAEMASLQKAAYLGIKAGNPRAVACLNVFAVHNRLQLDDLHDNRAWPYFDTYNLHHYESFDQFPKLYADHRSVSAGRPLWVTECAVPVKWAGDDKLKEPTDADLRVQAERVAKTFACSLHEGSAATFYFLLPHYVEGQVQFGIIRPDLTPRPAYVALAAAGRLLADAKPLGRLRGVEFNTRAFVFRAKPDGKSRDVLVAWTTNGAAGLNLPVEPLAVFDHLGRTRPVDRVLKLSSAPMFVLLRSGGAKQLEMDTPPSPQRDETGKPSSVVLQALWPSDKTDLKESAYRIATGKVEAIPVHLYNFSSRTVRGRLRVEAPADWKASLPGDEAELRPFERRELKLTLEARAAGSARVEILRIRGDFKSAGESCLSLRLMPQPAKSGD